MIWGFACLVVAYGILVMQLYLARPFEFCERVGHLGGMGDGGSPRYGHLRFCLWVPNKV